MPTTWLTPQLINRLEALQLSIKWVRAGHQLGGRFAINRRGSSVEFADHAPYSAGDDIRAIDWNLYARLDRLFIKTYKEEIALSVEILIDATPSMGSPTKAKFERAAQIAVSLGYVGLGDGHHVRAHWIRPGPRLVRSAWFHQRRDLPRMADVISEGHLGGPIGLAEWTRRAALATRMHGGQALLLTDGMVRPADFFRALHALMVRNIEVKVIQILAPQELHPAAFAHAGMLIDVESGASHQLAYPPAELERAVAQHNEQLARFCKRSGIPFAQHRLDEPLETFITKTLPARGFLE